VTDKKQYTIDCDACGKMPAQRNSPQKLGGYFADGLNIARCCAAVIFRHNNEEKWGGIIRKVHQVVTGLPLQLALAVLISPFLTVAHAVPI
jgi:hypothetical protein